MDDLLTTRQLQDLLRVDRITIYRMLNDGRLRGFKVGGQWRFSQREIEAWLLQQQQARPRRTPPLSLSVANSLPSSHLLPMSCILGIQTVCAEALDIAVVTTTLDGVPLVSVSNSSSFCNLILAAETGRRRCAESWRQQPDGQVHLCHAGLLCTSLPISLDGQPVAIAAACQFTSSGSNGAGSAWQSHVPELAAGLGLTAAELRAAASSVRAIPADNVPRISRLLCRVADTFAEIGQERVKLLGRLEKIAEMSRI